jgi:futalosine hydrolase
MKLLALLSSMQFESNMVRAAIKNVRISTVAGKKMYQGTLKGVNVILTNSGIGKINAAHSAACIMERFPVEGFINMGVGGAYDGAGLENGDIAVASKEILGDDGVIGPYGWSSMESIGIPLVQSGRKKYFNEFPLDNRICKKMIRSIKSSSFQPHVAQGPFVTVSAASGSPSRAGELESRFQGICENMEGAAIAHVCTLYNIPFFEVRGISNAAGIRDRRKWRLKKAADNCQKLVLASIKHITS